MQLEPDWSEIYNPESFAKDFGNEFSGPGFYLTKTDTLLAVPIAAPKQRLITAENVWHTQQSKGTKYRVFVYNSQFSQLLFCRLAIAPTRLDTR